jgi:haloacetate dehalogenase
MKLGEDFESFTIPIRYDVSIQGTQAGEGPTLLLLHGYPQTHLIWHKIAPKLTSKYRVIALDLRGYGGSSKPAGDTEHKTYSKSAMAQDVATVMARLNHERFYVCGHDRGGRVTHQLCINYPERIIKAMVLDIAPTLAMFQQTDQLFATSYWHWFFLIQPAPFPEQAINANPELWASKFFALPGVKPEVFHPDAMKAYVDLFRDYKGCHAMCEDYRAGASIDCEEQKADMEAGRKIRCPLKVLWGEKGLVERKFDALGEWRKVCEGEVVGEAIESGHYIPEEKPEELLEHMREWFQ